MEHQHIIQPVRQWVETVVIGMNLCPFAQREWVNNRIRFAVADARSETDLLQALQSELGLLNDDETIATTLLIHPYVLQDFYDYNQFLGIAESLLVQLKLEGVYQLASFHPDYQFGGTEPDDAENYTNRSPYPMLHLIREQSLEQAIASYSDIDQVPIRNIERMNELGRDKLQVIMQACFDRAAET